MTSNCPLEKDGSRVNKQSLIADSLRLSIVAVAPVDSRADTYLPRYLTYIEGREHSQIRLGFRLDP